MNNKYHDPIAFERAAHELVKDHGLKPTTTPYSDLADHYKGISKQQVHASIT